ncbi:MAG: type IV pilus biogenesis protein PilM [Clostridia bacterium]
MIFQKKIAGLEISPDKIRVVELAQGSPKPRLLNVGSIDLPEGAVKDGFIKKPDEVSNSLKKLWKEAGINTKDVLLGLNNQYVLVRVANMPKTNPEHVDRSILFQAQDHLPVPLSTVELDYLVIDDNVAGRPDVIKVMLVAGGKNMIQQHIDAIQDAGLRVVDIDISALALSKILTEEQLSGTNISINLCKDISVLVITSYGKPVFVRNMSVKITDEHVSGTDPNHDLSSLTSSISGDIIASVNYFKENYPDTNIGNIYMTGLLCRNERFLQAMNDDAGIRLIPVNPFEILSDKKNKTADIQIPGEYGVAAGLAIRGLEGTF